MLLHSSAGSLLFPGLILFLYKEKVLRDEKHSQINLGPTQGFDAS